MGGCCPEPCPSPQPTPSPAKRQCCGLSGCFPNSPEYDPATEQCCGEGENIFAPRVCSKDSGCCPGMYSAAPQRAPPGDNVQQQVQSPQLRTRPATSCSSHD